MSPAPLSNVLDRFRSVPEQPVIGGKRYDPGDWHVTVDMPADLGGLRKLVTLAGAIELVMRGQIEATAIVDDDDDGLPFKSWIVARAKQEQMRIKAERAAEAAEEDAHQKALRRRWAADEKRENVVDARKGAELKLKAEIGVAQGVGKFRRPRR